MPLPGGEPVLEHLDGVEIDRPDRPHPHRVAAGDDLATQQLLLAEVTARAITTGRRVHDVDVLLYANSCRELRHRRATRGEAAGR
jgi:hypothetical protein